MTRRGDVVGNGGPRDQELHITDTSERFELRENRRVGAPRPDRRRDRIDGLDCGDSLALCFEIDGGVTVGRVDAGVTEPVANGDQVDASLQEMDGGTVAHAMRVQSFARQGGRAALRQRAVLRQQKADAETRQHPSTAVDEERVVRGGGHAAFGDEVAEELGGLRPERAPAFLAALADQSHMKRLEQLQIGADRRG